MMDLPDRQTIRLRGFDYSSAGYYFVTICTDGRADSLGKIQAGKMVINNIGMVIDYWWKQIFQKFPNVELDQYQIMPNHLHGILIVGARFPRPNDIKQHPNDIKIDQKILIGRGNNIIGREYPTPTLGQIIAYFKYESTKSINNLPGGKSTLFGGINNSGGKIVGTGGGTPSGGETISSGGMTPPLRNLRLNLKFWQRNFYEHIIRNEPEYNKIVYYIQNNPKNWDRDKNNIHTFPQ